MKPILLVEDNPDDRDLTLMALERSRIANPVEVARDGEEALSRLLDAERPVPAFVLLDLKLPKIPGVEVLRRLRADPRARLVPVIVLTSSREERDLIETYDAGVNSYVRKPVDFDRFAEAVRDIGLYWLVMNEPPPAPGGEAPR